MPKRLFVQFFIFTQWLLLWGVLFSCWPPLGYLLGGSSWVAGMCAFFDEGISTVFCGSGLVWMPIYVIAFFVVHYFGAAKRNYAPFAVLVVSEALITAAWLAAVMAAGWDWYHSAVYAVSFALCGLKAALVVWLMIRAKRAAASPGTEPASALIC